MRVVEIVLFVWLGTGLLALSFALWFTHRDG